MPDRVFDTFLQTQLRRAAELSAESALVTLAPVVSDPDLLPRHFLAEFRCKGLVVSHGAEVTEAERFRLAIFFPDHYLKRPSSFESLCWLEPLEIQHPNIKPPFVCVGDAFMRGSPGVVEIAYQVFGLITYAKWSAADALSPTAAQWARRNQHRFPVDRRPLKRRALHVQLDDGPTRATTKGLVER